MDEKHGVLLLTEANEVSIAIYTYTVMRSAQLEAHRQQRRHIAVRDKMTNAGYMRFVEERAKIDALFDKVEHSTTENMVDEGGTL